MRNKTKKAAAQKGNTNAAKGRQQEPITDASGAATRALRHLLPVAVPPASSTEASYIETAADYQGGIRNDDEVLPPGQSAIESITIRQPHPLMQQRKQWRTMRVEGNGMI